MAPPPAPRHLRSSRRSALRHATALAAAATLIASGAATVVKLDRRGDRPATAPVVPIAADGAGRTCVDAAPLEQRAGLVLVVGLPGVTRADDPLVDVLAEVGVGGVMLRDENLTSLRQAKALVAGLRDRLGEHLLVAVDDEGGRVTSMRALGGTVRSARRLGQAGPKAAKAAGQALGELAASIGADWVFAPVVDIDGGPAAGIIGDRSFGADADTVIEAAGAFADGLHAAGVAVTIKHFPGHGWAHNDPHAGLTIDDRSLPNLLRADIKPFDALIASGADTVMVGHITFPNIWGQTPASLVPAVYELLRQRGFQGVAITDALGMGAVYNRWGFGQAPAMAVAAGADAVLVTQGERVLELRNGLVNAVQVGELDEARLDEAVGRVLTLRKQDPSSVLCT
ncbi:MAG: glycoside hydrolase family 3 N-terminal domain-containing protein [Acidimicrobiales bacterium]